MPESFHCALLFAGDPFLIEEKVKSVLQTHEKKDSTALSVVSYDLTETPLETVLIQARTLPFFAALQVFRLRGASALKKADHEALENYFSNPAAGTSLFFEIPSGEKSDALIKLIRKFGEVYLLADEEKKSAGRRFIQEKLKQVKKQMTPQAVSQLLEETQEHPALLDSMIERLVDFAGEKSQITEEMADTFKEDFQSVNVFALTEAIAAKQPGKAVALLLKYMDDNDKDWVGLLGLLHWQIRRLWQVKVLEEQGVSEAEILRRAKVSPKQLPFIMRQVKRFTRDQLERSLEELFQLDWKIKTGRAEEQPALEAWVVRTASAIS